LVNELLLPCLHPNAPPNLVSKAVDEAREILINNQVDDSDIKAKAKTVKLVIQDLAAQYGIDLKSRKKSK